MPAYDGTFSSSSGNDGALAIAVKPAAAVSLVETKKVKTASRKGRLAIWWTYNWISAWEVQLLPYPCNCRYTMYWDCCSHIDRAAVHWVLPWPRLSFDMTKSGMKTLACTYVRHFSCIENLRLWQFCTLASSLVALSYLIVTGTGTNKLQWKHISVGMFLGSVFVVCGSSLKTRCGSGFSMDLWPNLDFRIQIPSK